MSRGRLISLVALVLLAVPGGPIATAGTVAPVPVNILLGFVTLASGDRSCHWREQVVIRTQSQWLSRWVSHVGQPSQNPFSQTCWHPSSQPSVDFAHYSVVAIFAGSGPPRSLAIKRIVREANYDVVYYSLSAPSGTSPAVNPFQIVRTQRLNFVVRFVNEPSVIQAPHVTRP